MAATLQERRAAFVRRVWEHVVPQTDIASYNLSTWLPEKILRTLDAEVNVRDFEKIDLRNAEVSSICFAKVHRTLNREWFRLSAELTVLVEQSLNELGLWEGFDPRRIWVSKGRRDVASFRADLADVVFSSKRADLDRELQSLAVDLENRRIPTNANQNEEKVITAVGGYIKLRSYIDLSIASAERLPRSADLIDRIASRSAETQFQIQPFLEELIERSMFWHAPDGTVYIGGDDVPAGYRGSMRTVVLSRLEGFCEELDKFRSNLHQAIPPKEIAHECSETVRRTAMPVQNTTTNFHINNSQIGVLNTGTIKNVQSIDTSITALKSMGQIDIGEAFQKLTSQVANDQELPEGARAELLENIKYLSENATKEKEERSQGVVKSVLRTVSDGLEVAGPALKALLPIVTTIATFFGVAGAA